MLQENEKTPLRDTGRLGKSIDPMNWSREEQIKAVFEQMERLLQHKNKKYGDSALQPMRCFSQSEENDIYSRLDEKLKRIKNRPKGSDAAPADVIDVMGYCALELIRQGFLRDVDFDRFMD